MIIEKLKRYVPGCYTQNGIPSPIMGVSTTGKYVKFAEHEEALSSASTNSASEQFRRVYKEWVGHSEIGTNSELARFSIWAAKQLT